jgi:hypothetical protein
VGRTRRVFGITPSLFALILLPERKILWPYCDRVDKEALTRVELSGFLLLKV